MEISSSLYNVIILRSKPWTIRGLYLYFSQLKLEEVRARGLHKHSREKLGVGFHLEQKQRAARSE